MSGRRSSQGTTTSHGSMRVLHVSTIERPEADLFVFELKFGKARVTLLLTGKARMSGNDLVNIRNASYGSSIATDVSLFCLFRRHMQVNLARLNKSPAIRATSTDGSADIRSADAWYESVFV
jgi:hypothetical protein